MEERILRWVSGRIASKVASSVTFTKGFDPGMFSGRVERMALNLRIPFCRMRCAFCAFPGEVFTESYKRVFVDGLKDELRFYSDHFERGNGSRPVVERVYLSGGTPTLLYKEFGEIKGFVNEHFPFHGNIAMEAYPSDLTDEVLRSMVDNGVEQISVGVQTFNDGLLSRMGRKGGREEVVKTLRRVMDYGFSYVNIDLMFALSNQTKEMLIEDLETATRMGVHGVSTYPLMILPYTGLGKGCSTGAKTRKWMVQDRKDEEREQELYSAIVDYMEGASYKVRAIWSFSLKPEAYEGPYEHECFIGLGPRAWGMINNRFTLNAPSTEDYIATLTEGKLPLHATSEVRGSPTVRLARHLYHGRVHKDVLKRLVGGDFKLRGLVGLLRMIGLLAWDGDCLRLTRKGLAYGNLSTKKIAMAMLAKMDEILRAG